LKSWNTKFSFHYVCWDKEIMSKTISKAELSKHNSEKNGVWIVIDGNVYDMSSLYPPPLVDKKE